MGWWGYHTNAGDSTQDEICDMTDKLRILNYGFGERLNKIGQSVEKKKTNNNCDDHSKEDVDSREDVESNEKIESEENVESADEEELIYLEKNKMKKKYLHDDPNADQNNNGTDKCTECSDSESESDHISDENMDEDELNNRSWWNKRYEIEQYVKTNIEKLSEATFIVAGIAWELFERSPSINNTLPNDFPEDLRIMALESAKAYYEEMKIKLMADKGICRNSEQCLVDLHEEINVFSKK
jgi:hypothetical protein